MRLDNLKSFLNHKKPQIIEIENRKKQTEKWNLYVTPIKYDSQIFSDIS